MGEERFYNDIAECPCGDGKIVSVFHSPENGWSRPYETTEINCLECDKAWDLDFSGKELIDRASRAESRNADSAAKEANIALVTYLNSILPKVTLPAFKTQAKEHEFLANAGLYHGKVGEYRYERRTKTMEEIARVRADSPIVHKLIEKAGEQSIYEGLVQSVQHADVIAKAKRDAIKRFKIQAA